MSYQEYQILSEFSTSEKYTADSQRLKENPYLLAITINQVETVQYFHYLFLLPFQPCATRAFSFFYFFETYSLWNRLKSTQAIK